MIILDNSRVATFCACPRAYYLRYVKNLVRNERSSTAADFGTCIHKFLELFYSGKEVNESMKSAIEEYNKLIGEDEFYTIERLEEACSSYVEQWREEDLEPIYVETYFTIPLDYELLFEGRIDLIARSKTGMTYVIDHKTTKRSADK